MKKYLIITIIVILIFAGCGKKEEAADSGSGKNNSSSSAESSAETNNVTKNPYFLKDSIYVPVEIAFSDSDYSIQYEYNDKGWLTRSYEKDTDYEQVSDFLYEEDGNLVNVTVKKALYDPEYEPKDSMGSDGYVRSESKYIVFNDDGTTDKYETNGFGSLEVTERDYKGRAKSFRYSETNTEYGDYSGTIEYMAEAMIYEEKDADGNSKGTMWYSNCHNIPVFATRVSDDYLPVPYYPGKFNADSNGLIIEDPERGLKFAYDDNKRLVSVSEGENTIGTLTYDNDGKLILQTDEHGSLETKYKYDENGNISEISVQVDKESPEIMTIKYKKVPLSMAGLCSFWLVENTYVLDLTDYNLLWNVPYMVFRINITENQ